MFYTVILETPENNRVHKQETLLQKYATLKPVIPGGTMRVNALSSHHDNCLGRIKFGWLKRSRGTYQELDQVPSRIRK